MTTEIKIKRSGSSNAPTALGSGELAYSWSAGTGGKLFIGWGSENVDGEAANIDPIGGKYYTDLLGSTAGTIAGSKAVILDANSKVNQWNVDNITIDGNTISTADTNGNLLLSPNGSGVVSVEGSKISNVVTPTADSDAATKGYVDTQLSGVSSTITLTDDASNTDAYTTGNALTFAGGTGLTSVVTDDTVTFNMDNTSVSFGGVSVALGGTSAQPAFDLTNATNYPTSSLSGTITNDQLAGSIANGKLANSNVTVGTTAISLGGSSTTLAGLTQVDIDNVQIKDNSILTTDANGDLTLAPNGTGVVKLPSGYESRTNLDANSVVPKSYVDAIAEGLHVHASAKAATTTTLALESGDTVTYNNGTDGVGATLTLSTGISTLDEYTLVDGDRILIKDETAQEHNGIYIRTSSTVFTRATDFDTIDEIASGDFLFVENGTVNGSNGYVQTETHTAIGGGADDIIFEQFSGAGQIDAGNGLTKSGNTINAVGTADKITVASDAISIASTYVGQNSITTLGTITTGVWNGTTVGVQHGGTGAATFTDNGVIYGNGTGALSVTAVSADSGSVLQTLTPGGAPVFSNIIDCGEY